MHLFPELDSKAERVPGRFQFCRFRERGREREKVGEKEREDERDTEHSSPSEPLCSSISQWSSELQEGGRSQLQAGEKQEQKGGEFSVWAKWYPSFQLASSETRSSVLAKPSPLVLTYKTSPNTCSGLMSMTNTIFEKSKLYHEGATFILI